MNSWENIVFIERKEMFRKNEEGEWISCGMVLAEGVTANGKYWSESLNRDLPPEAFEPQMPKDKLQAWAMQQP